MKKNCNGCRALKIISNTGGMGYCELGFKTKSGDAKFNGINIRTIPLEECPKPLKVMDYVNLIMNK